MPALPTPTLVGPVPAPPATVPELVVLTVLTVVGSVVDVRTGRLPNALTLPAGALGLLALLPLGFSAVVHGLVGGVLLGVAHAGAYLLAPGGLGGGDDKAAGALGVPLGALCPPGLLGAPVLAALALLAAAVALRRRRLPFGPALLGSGWLLVVLAVS